MSSFWNAFACCAGQDPPLRKSCSHWMSLSNQRHLSLAWARSLSDAAVWAPSNVQASWGKTFNHQNWVPLHWRSDENQWVKWHDQWSQGSNESNESSTEDDKTDWLRSQFWIHILDVPLSRCVTLDKLLSLSKPQFTHLSNGDSAYSWDI